MSPSSPTRRYDLDWLRVLLILSVFIFHVNMAFNGDYFHVENGQKSLFLAYVHAFLKPIMMPMIFLVSAAAMSLALNKLSPGRFLLERAKRLLVPLAVGIFILAPHQIYLEGLTHGGSLQSIDGTAARSAAFAGSFLQFLPHYFDGMYAFGGNFAWMGLHLWYLEFLFIFTLILLPALLFLRSQAGLRLVRGLARFCSKPGAIYLLGLAFIIPLSFLEDDGLGMDKFGGNSLIIYLIDMLLGLLLFADRDSADRYRAAIIRHRWVSLAVGLAILYPFFYEKFHSGPIGEFDALLDGGFAWLWMLTVLGFGMKHLNRNSRLLGYANEAVLPFYMLHQPVLILVGYFVVQTALPIALKFALIALISFPVIMVLYEFGVRRVNVLRFLFGMKPLPKEQPAPAPVLRPAA